MKIEVKKPSQSQLRKVGVFVGEVALAWAIFRTLDKLSA